MSNKWCWESLDSFNSVCVKTNYWRSLDIYLLLSFPPNPEKGTLGCAWCLWPWLQKNVHPYQHVYWSTLWRGVTKHQDLRLSDFSSLKPFNLSPLDSSLATFPVADGQLCEAAGCLSPGQAPCQPQSGPRVIFIFNVPH